jgi:hypothetical protein
MDEEVINDLYNRAKSKGYTKSRDEFVGLLHKDNEVFNDMYSYVKSKGYKKDANSFSNLVGKKQEEPLKKKSSLESPELQERQTATTELPSVDGSLDTPVIDKKKFSLTAEDLKQIGKKQPTDMSGKPLLPSPDKAKGFLEKVKKEKEVRTAEEKKYGDIFDKQLNMPKPSESSYLKERLKSIDDDLISYEQEYVVPQLKYQFGDLGFEFEESGVIGDYVKVTAPNKKTIEISTDNLFNSKSKEQSEILKKFITENTPAKGLFVLEKTMKEQDIKFNSEKQVDQSIKSITKEVSLLNQKQKELLTRKAQLEKDIENVKLNPTPEGIQAIQDVIAKFDADVKSVLEEESSVKSKGLKLNQAVAKYGIQKAKQGSWSGGIWDSINRGIGKIASGTTSLVTDIATEIAPTGFGMSQKDLKNVSTEISKQIGVKPPSSQQTVDDWKKTLTEDQLNEWEDKVDDYIKKDIKSKTLPYIRIGAEEIFGDPATTTQWSNLKKEGFWGGAILGVAESLPAMIGGGNIAGWAQRTAQMYAQISDGISEEMENNPEFANITENEKLAITLPIGITSAVLEAYGLRNVLASKGVINSIAMSVLGKVGKGTSAKTFRELVQNEVESKLARGLITISAAGVAEFETGAAQELSETGFKVLYDEIKGKDMFNTPDSKLDLVENVLVAGAQEAVGGFLLGIPSGVSVAYSKKGFLNMDDSTFETFASMANDTNIQSAYIASLKQQITQGIITEKEAKEQLNDYRNSVGLYRQLPEGLTTQQKKEAMNLLKEKRDLENYVEGKDPSLVVKAKNRIEEIKESLNKLSEQPSAEYIINDKQYTKEEFLNELKDKTQEELKAMSIVVNNDEQTAKDINEKFKTDAVQEQKTDEGVLQPEQPEVGLQEMEQGDQVNQVVTEQGVQEEVVGIPDEVSQPIELSVSPEVTTEGPPPVPEGFDIVTEQAPAVEAPVVETINLEQITKNSYVDRISRNIIEKVGNNWVVKTEVEGKELFKSKTLKGAKEFVSNDNQEALRIQPTETTIETAPVEEKFIIDGKEYTKEEAIEKSQNNSRLPIYGSKMEYSGNDPEAKRFVEEYNRDSNPYNNNGDLKGSYIQEQILKALNEMNFRKFGNLYRKHIDSNFSRANNEKSVGGLLDKNYSFKELAGYIIGDAASSSFKEADFRAFAKEAGISIPENQKVKSKAKPAPVVEESILEEAPTVKPKPALKVEQKIAQIDAAIQSLFDRNGTDTTKWVNQSDNRDLIALKRAKKALSEDTKSLKTFLATPMGKRYSEMEAKFEAPIAEAKAEVAPVAETPKVEAPKKPSNLDKKIAEAEKDVEFYEFKISDLEVEIKDETQNTKDEVADLNKKIEEVKKDTSLSRAEKKEAIEDLKYEIENFKENQQDTINDLKDDLKEAKSELKKSEKKLEKLNSQRGPVVEEVVEEEVKGKLDELLELDPNDKTTLGKISSELGDMINEFKRIEKDLGSNILLVPMRYVLQAIKGFVDAGMSLQEAIKQVASDENLKVRDIIKGINSVNEIVKIAPAYNALMEKADKLIARQKSKGVDDKKIIANLDKMVRESDIYKDPNTNDAQRKIMEREARAKMGVAPKRAVSIGRVIGALNDIRNVSRAEKLKIISRIRELSKDATKDLVEEIRELAKKGNITPTQAVNLISKFGKVNLLNESSVATFVDYMTKVFADAEYDNKISVAKGKLKAAKKSIATKIGIANGLAFPLQTLFSINPSLIPVKNLERYMELVKMFSDRKSVLQLDEISQVINDVNDILNEIDNEQSLVPELTFRLNNSKNQVLKDGELDYAATIKKMIKENEITQEEADLMVKYKKEIVPQEGKAKKTDAEIEAERKELEAEVKKAKVNFGDLPTRDERAVAKRIADHLKKPFISQLSNIELNNLIKAIDNINNGYLPHQAELILEKIDGFSDAKAEVKVIENGSLATIGKIYNSIKSKFTDNDAVFEMIRRAPLFNIDQVLGNFKTKELFDALLGRSATAEARFSFALKTIDEKLKKAQDKVAKSEGYFKSMNPLKAKISSYKIKTYLIQLEHNTNPGDPRVNQASEYIKETVKHINRLKSQYNENDVEILQDILDKYGKVVGKDKDGKDIIQIDIDKLYNSFSKAEKEAIKTLQEIKKEETEKAEFTAAVIRGKRINPLNNHTHISVLSEDSKEDLDSGASFADEYNKSLNPSTKAKNLMERSPGAKAINFDAYATAHKSAKYVLMDYYLTAPIRTARKSLNAAEAELEKDGQMSKEKRRIFNAVKDSFETAVKDLVTNSYVQTSTSQDISNYISKQGYRAVLAGLGRSGVELLSNLGYISYDPFTFAKGLEYMGILLSEDGPAIMNVSGSVQTPRVYASGLSGKMIDTGILDQSIGTKSSKTRGKVVNKALQVWNLTGKKGLNAVELTADALITSPDKLVMRPYWMGSFATELEKQYGRKVSREELKKIAQNDEAYVNENQEAIDNARKVADKKSVLMGATKNGFTGLLRGKIRPEDKGYEVFLKNFNGFMTNFMIFEYNAARAGVMSAIGKGDMTKAEGASILAGVITRMTVYNLLIKAATSGIAGLLGMALGFEDDDEEEEKTINQMLGQSLSSTFASLILGRDFGNITKTVVNYGFEELVTKEYLEGLRTGEYDPYKDAVLFNSLQTDPRTGEIKSWENIPNFMGAYGPMAKTAALGIKVITADEKKEADAIERQEKERNIRLPLEILGNAGYIPLYKEIRKSVMDDIYKDLKNNSKKGVKVMSREEFDKLTE